MYADGQLALTGRVHSDVRERKPVTDKVATSVSYAASAGTATWSILTVQEWGVVAGILIGVATWCTNAYYKRKDEARKAELQALDIEIRRKQLEG